MLTLTDVTFRYGDDVILDAVSLTLERGQIGCILGPSGSGKTTLLRCIAGFEPVCGGEIHAGSNKLSSPLHQVPPELRRIGMVFQDYALLPHLSTLKNVAFGLRGMSSAEKRSRAVHFLKKVGLEDLAERYPH
ncbi:MAG TPA: ATP-binding cassette domain-containing protein, partial [Woeseiaceae bacterium]